MTEHTVSSSATILVRLRAAHQVLDADPKILVDPISVGFVPGSSAEELRADATNLQHPMMRALRAMAVVRLRYVEDVLQELAAFGVRQYVNLGAGLDTFAYRHLVVVIHVWEGSAATVQLSGNNPMPHDGVSPFAMAV